MDTYKGYLHTVHTYVLDTHRLSSALPERRWRCATAPPRHRLHHSYLPKGWHACQLRPHLTTSSLLGPCDLPTLPAYFPSRYPRYRIALNSSAALHPTMLTFLFLIAGAVTASLLLYKGYHLCLNSPPIPSTQTNKSLRIAQVFRLLHLPPCCSCATVDLHLSHQEPTSNHTRRCLGHSLWLGV